MNEFGNSKLFELYLILQYVTWHIKRAIYFHRHGNVLVLPADDLAECQQS